jgi:predicted alpha/beta-fold hydrolase
MVQSDSSICGLGTKEKMNAGYDFTESVVINETAKTDEPFAQLEMIARELQAKPFVPHPRFKSGHAQTFAAYYWPRRGVLLRAHQADEPRIFEVEPEVRLLAQCRWQKDRRAHPTIILIHGLEGSNSSIYMLGTSEKAFQKGFNVVRLNLRNCGDTEHMTPTLYHAGMSGDLRTILRELIEQDGLSNIFVAGFSMGGNISLLLAGEEAEVVPRELAGVCAVSPTIDLRACVDAIEWRSNRLYKYSFLRSMKKRIRRKQRLFPELYDTKGLSRIRRLRDFDERYTSRGGGFSNAEEYYERASALQFIRHIRTPALMIHAQDDPFVPFQPFRDPSIAENPYLLFLAPENGGHVGFVGAEANGEDRFWMENRLVEFCKLVIEQSNSSND